jgi:hypothetical protein
MGKYFTNIDRPAFKMDHGDQAKFIAGDIKNIPVIPDIVTGIEGFLQFIERAPIVPPGFQVPFVEGIGTDRISKNKISDDGSRNDDHSHSCCELNNDI